MAWPSGSAAWTVMVRGVPSATVAGAVATIGARSVLATVIAIAVELEKLLATLNVTV